jgi:hypothetical protein
MERAVGTQASENTDIDVRNQKSLVSGKAGASAAPRRFGTSLSVNSNNIAPKAAPIGKASASLASNAYAPHLTEKNRAEPTTRDNVTASDIAGALDIDHADK